MSVLCYTTQNVIDTFKQPFSHIDIKMVKGKRNRSGGSNDLEWRPNESLLFKMGAFETKQGSSFLSKE